MWWSKPKASPEPTEPAPLLVRVVYSGAGIIIGGRVLQEDDDPLDLMELYLEEGPPSA